MSVEPESSPVQINNVKNKKEMFEAFSRATAVKNNEVIKRSSTPSPTRSSYLSFSDDTLTKKRAVSPDRLTQERRKTVQKDLAKTLEIMNKQQDVKLKTDHVKNTKPTTSSVPSSPLLSSRPTPTLSSSADVSTLPVERQISAPITTKPKGPPPKLTTHRSFPDLSLATVKKLEMERLDQQSSSESNSEETKSGNRRGSHSRGRSSVIRETNFDRDVRDNNVISIVKIQPGEEETTFFKQSQPIIEPSNLPAFNVELGEPIMGEHAIKLTVPKDIYAREYYTSRHYNYIGNFGEESMIVSVQAYPEDGRFRGLKTTKKGQERFYIDESAIVEKHHVDLEDLPGSRRTRIAKHLPTIFPDYKFYRVKSDSFPDEILTIEQKHPQDNKKCMKIAIVYSKSGQVDPKEMFTNNEASPAFQIFLDTIGTLINLEEWTGYRGDVGRHGFSYFSDWQGFSVMFHVSTMMDSEGHRRLIGNDFATIFFHEGAGPFNPTQLDNLGTVPQIFAVVQPCLLEGSMHYRMGFMNRVNIKNYGPVVPSNHLFNATSMKDFLMAKMTNGYMTCLTCPPMNRLFFVPRNATIQELTQRYSASREKNTKSREKADQTYKANLRKQGGKYLIVRVVSAKNLPPSCDPFCSVKIREQQSKTEVMKKCANPYWDQKFTFDLVGYSDASTELILRCVDHCTFRTDKDEMGHLVLSLDEIRRSNKKQIWYKLQQAHYGKEEAAGAEVLLDFLIQETKA